MARPSPNTVGDSTAKAAIADYTFTYGTDDPSITAASTIAITDGDSVTAAENHDTCFDLAAKINLILAALRDVGIIQT